MNDDVMVLVNEATAHLMSIADVDKPKVAIAEAIHSLVGALEFWEERKEDAAERIR